MLKTVAALMFKEIPADPNAKRYRLGHSLGSQFTSSRRAKFFGRFRFFFRFHSQRRAIVYVWLNDEHTLRKAGARTDPYAVFATMLASGEPPDDIDDLLRASGALPPPDGPSSTGAHSSSPSSRSWGVGGRALRDRRGLGHGSRGWDVTP